MSTNNEKIIKEGLKWAYEIRNVTSYGNFQLAGGAVRDYIHSKPIRDLDFFMSKHIIPRLTAYYTIHREGKSFYDNGFDVYSIPKVNEIMQAPIQIITYNRSFNIHSFDIELCKAWIEIDTGTLHRTEGFKKDSIEKTITSVSEYDSKYNNEHVERVKAKYPDHKVVYTPPF